MRKIIVITSHYIVDAEPQDETEALDRLEEYIPTDIGTERYHYTRVYAHSCYKEAV
jgi:hypothetical protein